MEGLSPEVARTLRAVAEVFVPGAPSDPTPGAPEVSAEFFLHHYLEYLIPGLSLAMPAILDGEASERYAKPFVELDVPERERVLDRLADHEVEEIRRLPALLGVLSVGAVYGEWTGQDAEGAIVRTPLGWQLTGFEGPVRGRPRLLRRER